jgi:hypothetical protein
MKHATLGLATALTLLLASSAVACLHAPQDSGLKIEQEGQTAVIFWADGRQELFLSVDYEVKGGVPNRKSASTGLAWVIPVPSAPDSYQVAEAGLFDLARAAWHEAKPKVPAIESDGPLARSLGPKSASRGIRLLEKVDVGDYEIQPIQTKDKESGAALNAWLTGNGFAEVPAGNMAYYLERSWTWLAVKAKPAAGATKGKLKPLQISFASDEIVYPLKFSSHQGKFRVELYVVTEKPLADFSLRDGAYRYSKPASHGFRLEGYELELPDGLWDAHEKAKDFSGFPTRKVMMTRVFASRVNNATDPIAEWTTDLAFRPQPGAKTPAAKTPATKTQAPSSGFCELRAPSQGGGAWLLALVAGFLLAVRRRQPRSAA